MLFYKTPFKGIYLSVSPLPFSSLLFSPICKASSDNHFAFLHFFFLGLFWSPPHVQCYEPLSIVLQSLWLSDLIPWIYLSLPLYNHKGFDLWPSAFPYFFQFKPEFCNKELMIRDIVNSRSCFADCLELFHLHLQRI